MEVLAVVGSLRRDSWNRRLLGLAAQAARGRGLEVEWAEIGAIPLYSQDLEEEGIPRSVAAWREAVANAGGLLIASPEYNGAIPGVLKNAIDWASRPPNAFSGKVVLLMGASTGRFGAVLANAQLAGVLTGLNAWVVPQPRVLIPQAMTAFDEEGQLRAPELRELLDKAVARFAEVLEDRVAARVP